MLTFEKFSVSPIKVRVLFTKKLLNYLGYNLDENFIEDKKYKKALKDYQIKHGFVGNCVVSKDVFKSFKNEIPNIQQIWKNLN